MNNKVTELKIKSNLITFLQRIGNTAAREHFCTLEARCYEIMARCTGTIKNNYTYGNWEQR